MAKSVNKVVLLGNVGKQPEIRDTRSGLVAEISVAMNERRPDSHGGWMNHTEWHTVVAFQRTAEIIREYVQTGSKIFVEGSLQTESWDDTNAGVKRYWTKIIVFNLVLIPRDERRTSYAEDRGESDDFTSLYGPIPDGEITEDEIPF